MMSAARWSNAREPVPATRPLVHQLEQLLPLPGLLGVLLGEFLDPALDEVEAGSEREVPIERVNHGRLTCSRRVIGQRVHERCKDRRIAQNVSVALDHEQEPAGLVKVGDLAVEGRHRLAGRCAPTFLAARPVGDVERDHGHQNRRDGAEPDADGLEHLRVTCRTDHGAEATRGVPPTMTPEIPTKETPEVTTLMIYSCSACNASSQPSEAEPSGWKRYDNDTRLLCSYCRVLRRTGCAGHPQGTDDDFRKRLGLVVATGDGASAPQTLCAGCRRPFTASGGADYCPTCVAVRRNPRHYSPAELRGAGVDPSVFSEEVTADENDGSVNPRQAERIARDEARAAAWSAQR
jgi:hypothetical protein